MSNKNSKNMRWSNQNDKEGISLSGPCREAHEEIKML